MGKLIWKKYKSKENAVAVDYLSTCVEIDEQWISAEWIGTKVIHQDSFAIV